VVNANFLALEIIVVLINAGIAWLLLRDPPMRKLGSPGGQSRQRAVLADGDQPGAGAPVSALRVLLLISKAALPTFEGFYFLFGDNSQRQLVTPILYIEVALIIINGGLLWLLLKDKTPDEASAEQIKNPGAGRSGPRRNTEPQPPACD
jgi:hypothetical protein